ncbi:CinA family protein [Legionella spiritensis]|uniref:Competence-damage inducible protein CinA n=1 Tax=Legionella spiritensis TaxID=452 RepID=A0A0W0Z9H6_LEGSP|nr:CinA family protein [Legionella spiritensis]KTD65751.1 Competence-damage inducible protein CinA [Legionella spiritensis]SNV42719.1 Competence-damage inducible protein CinA [Legionella spiritensis]VEG90592.1 Competence-damage inducible protein CinA [Legionella spiritensis]
MNSLRHLLPELTRKLLAMNLMITTAESCTGGMIASLLTELPGSSVWFERGFVTYSNAAKQEMLGVDKHLIQSHGAVSIPVAEAMATGALHHSRADVALSVTGVAGPDGGTLDKPVGTVCFAFTGRDMPLRSQYRSFPPSSSREQIRQWSCIDALQGMISLLNESR